MVKKNIMAILTIFILGISSPAFATLYADFWATDVNGGGVTLDFNLLSTPATLWFSTDNSNWIRLFRADDAYSLLTSSLTMADTTHLYLKMDLNDAITTLGASAAAANVPTVLFSGPDGNDLYNALFIQWTGAGLLPSLSFITPEGGDNVSATPIPSAAFLLCSGLVGFVVFRRRNRRQSL